MRNPNDFVTAEDDIAVFYGRMAGQHTGELMGIPPTGRHLDVATMDALRFAEGRAIKGWGLADNMAMVQQLGLLG